MPTEADTCRTLVLPKLYAAGWTDEQIAEQRYFTDAVHKPPLPRTEKAPPPKIEKTPPVGAGPPPVPFCIADPPP
jgi:hypothetical protein